MKPGTVLLLSGGVDSAVALSMQTGPVETLTIDYGQRHRKEIDAAKKISAHYGVNNITIELDNRLFGGVSALTDRSVKLPTGHATSPDFTYVPARNTVFLALAAARAESIGANRVVIGCNADDAGAYPDCSLRYIQSFRDVLIDGTIGKVWVSAPLIGLTKRQIISEAYYRLVPIELTWSCYAGSDTPCGVCGACESMR